MKASANKVKQQAMILDFEVVHCLCHTREMLPMQHLAMRTVQKSPQNNTVRSRGKEVGV